MDPNSIYGMAIGNLTSQAGSNLNLNEFDKYIVNELKLTQYIRYVDDMVIISNNKKNLINALPYITKKLSETYQKINMKKTKIDTAYHGVPFLGKISYPYGYQKPKKETIIRTYNRAKEIKYDDIENLLAKTNSQIGSLKNYNCRKLILNYAKMLLDDAKNILTFDENNCIFRY